ncbi:hypothetical protein HG531_000762 [Fusarium graminearum]|nr:hypothetical protein HG531_000762 [Fusarium graminearum]
MKLLERVGLGGITARLVGITSRVMGVASRLGRIAASRSGVILARVGLGRLVITTSLLARGSVATGSSLLVVIVVVSVALERTTGGAVARNGSRLRSLNDRGDGDGAVSLSGSLLATKVASATLDSLGDGEDASGLFGRGDLRVVYDLGDNAGVASSLSGARCNGVHVCGSNIGSEVNGAGGMGSTLAFDCGRVRRRIVRAWTVGCERGDGLRGDLADRAVCDAGGAGGNGVDLAGDDGRGDGGGSRRVSVAGKLIRHSIRASTDGDKVGTTVLVVGDPDITVIPIIDDVSSAEESVTKNGEFIVLEDTENAAVIVVPDEVGVGDLDGLVAKLEVNAALDVGDGTVDIDISTTVGLCGRESGNDLVEDGSGQGADGRVNGAVLLNEANAIEADPVSGEAIRRRSGGDDGELLETASVLGGINATKDNSTSVAVNCADIERQSTALDETLLDHAVNDQRVRRIPTVQIRASTHDTNTGEGAVCDFVLSLGDALDDGCAGANFEREADEAIWAAVVGANGDVGGVEGGCECGGRNGQEKSGQHL